MDFEIREPNPILQFAQSPSLRVCTARIILHHYHSEIATPQDVHRWHLERGWIGNGYNFMVDMDGTIWSGRGLDAVGTHTANNNVDSIGVACQGRYDDLTKKMPDAQFNSLVWLIRHIHSIYGEVPVVGHRDASPSACPGRFFPMDEVRQLQFRGERVDEMRINTIDEVPNWAQPFVQDMLDRKILTGTGHELDITLDMIRTWMIVERMLQERVS